MKRLPRHRSLLPACLARMALACAVLAPAAADAAAPHLRADTGSLAFGLQQIGAPAARRTVVITNTGKTGLALDTPTLSIPAGFVLSNDSTCIGVLRAGASCSVTVSYSAKTAGTSQATLTVGSAAQSVRIALSGAGTSEAVGRPVLGGPARLKFARAAIGSVPEEQTVVLANRGGTAFRIGAVDIGGAAQRDYSSFGSCARDVSLSPGATCYLTVAFKPSAPGTRPARLSLDLDTGARLDVDLNGAGLAAARATPPLQVQPAAYVFPARTLGRSTPPKAFGLTNTSTHPVQLHAARVQGPFKLVAGGCPTPPFTLAPGKACELRAAFTPTRTGAVRGALTLHTPAAPGGWEVGLAGLAADPARRVVLGGTDDPAMLFLGAAAAGVLVYRWRHHKRTGGHVK